MPSSLSPLLGYNTNVRHKGKVFHVQTEDSGIRYGHVITHLFVDGGRILKSLKSSYAQSVGAEDQCEVVRALMKRQHKAMLMALRDGRFDLLAESADAAGGASPASGPKMPMGKARVQSVPPKTHATGKGQASSPKAPPVTPKWQDPPVEVGFAPRAAPDRMPRPGAALGPSHPSSPRAPARAQVPAARAPSSERRLVPSRPASAFGHAKPHQGKSIFGQDASTDESLDDVIRSYLALDADPEDEA
ncbi:MAG TPA: hypothetical protein VEK07_12230 [Polyangiaceae bacterium]|nr:hypothetical protein [Polyangiaceae bacterium]